MGLPADVVPSSAQREALQRLEASRGLQIETIYNTISRAPRALRSAKPLTGPSSADPTSIARTFIKANKNVWGLSDLEVNGLRLDTNYTDPHSGTTHLYFTQMLSGVEVFPSSLGVSINNRGEIISIRGDVFPGLPPAPAARLSSRSAAEAAAKTIGVEYRAISVRTEDDAEVLAAGPFFSEVKVRPCVYALFGRNTTAYRMVMEKNGREWYDLVIDGNTAQVVNRRNLYVDSGLLTPSSPAEANPAPPRALVFLEHPLSTVRGTGEQNRKYSYTADPTGQTRGYANGPLNGADSYSVTVHGGEASIAQSLLPMPNSANPSRSNSLPLLSTPQSPSGWFILQNGHYMTIGNNVDAKDDQAGDNETTIGLRADGGLNGDFSGPSFVYQNHYAQNGPYANAAARYVGAAPDLPVATLNLFFYCNWYHDFLYHLGFTEAAGNFQLDNFNRGGLGGDHVFADAQDGSGTDNANFGTPADGQNPRMQMFLFTGNLRDGDLDADVVFHEHTHGLSNRLVGGPSNTSCLGVGLVGEAGGMGEGWSDWYAAMVSDEPAEGEYVVNDRSNGIRRFSMNNGPDDFTYRYICTGPLSNPSLTPCEVHDVGEFWSIVLWEMREAMINRQHNRAFPNGPGFPTFTGTGSPAGNIRNAEGRTFDGSGQASRIDNVTIESSTFAALFDVTDGMKLAPCNPTMVDMRDAIIAADRAVGGAHVDLIWRAFANRGLGSGAFSSGSNQGGAPAIVEDFAVPQTVTECESAGGPLPPPDFTAISNSANTVDITITPNGAAEYIIYRGLVAAGTAVQPAPFVEINRSANTTFTDTNRDGGVQIYYRVRAARNDDCVSESTAVSVIPLGGPIPCSTAPTFIGLRNVIGPGDCQHLRLDWSSATSNCSGGLGIKYNIYRDTNPAFTPGASNRIATGVAGNTFVDTPGSLNTVYYYVVRAEDATTGGSGPGGGNEDSNTIRRPGMVTSASLVPQGFTDDVETGPDNLRSAHFTSNGMTSSNLQTRGGWFRDENPALISPHSGTHVWHTYDPDNKSLAPDGNAYYELRTDALTITPTSILSWYQTIFSETAFDGGVVEAALVDSSGNVAAFADIGSLIYENPYNGVLDGSGSDNALVGRAAYTGGTLGHMIRTRAFLGGLVPIGQTSQRLIVRFLFGSDVANTISVPPVVEGDYFPGWYIDDVSLDESCCPIPSAPQNLAAVSSGNNQITLTWSPPAGGGSIGSYRIFREDAGENLPIVLDHQIGSVPGAQTTFVDTQASGGFTFAYVVRAIPASGCPSGDSNVAIATATGLCQTGPTFAGLKRVTSPPRYTCSLQLTWQAGASNCPGASVQYNIYRNTNATFTPGPSNLLRSGVSGESYLDQYQLASGTTYYYVVRAEDSTSNGDGPANSGNEDNNVVRLGGSAQGLLIPGPDFSDDLEPSSNAGYQTFSTRDAGGWQVLADPTAHSLTQAWVALDDQPGSPTLTQKDDRLTLPPLNLSATSVMTFWHNFDFARFSELPTPPARFESGGILEISADGETWFDLKDFITLGGYNGAIDSGALNPLAGRDGWVGSSDGSAGGPQPGRTDMMHQVSVDLGAAIQNPDLFAVTTLAGAQLRFRLGGTYQVLIGGVQGSGWGIDDITITNVLTASACQSCPSCIGDVNADGYVDARDIQGFISCVFGACPVSPCTDFDGDGTITLSDVPVFVDKLLNEGTTACQ